MVLEELGRKISEAIKRAAPSSFTDVALDELLKDIGNALLEADVNVMTVVELRKNIKQKIQNAPAGINKTRAVEQASTRTTRSLNCF